MPRADVEGFLAGAGMHAKTPAGVDRLGDVDALLPLAGDSGVTSKLAR